MLKSGSILSMRLAVVAGPIVVLLGLSACSQSSAENPFDQSAYTWPATYPASLAVGAHAVSANAVFTVRTSEWLNTTEEARGLIADQCGPAFKTARVFRHEGNGSPLHPVELVVFCGDLRPRFAVYPEPDAGPVSEILSQLTTAPASAESGELVTLR